MEVYELVFRDWVHVRYFYLPFIRVVIKIKDVDGFARGLSNVSSGVLNVVDEKRRG